MSEQIYNQLDPAHIAGHLSTPVKRIADIQAKVVDHYQMHGGYVAWSGGKDSTALVSIVRQVIPDVKVVWFNSGLEFPDTEPYIMSLAEKWKLNLTVLHVKPSALEILAQSGVWDHKACLQSDIVNFHNHLVTSPSVEAHLLFGYGELSGMRAEESVGRRALLARDDGHYKRQKDVFVYAPIWDWSGTQVKNYFAQQEIPLNPVYTRLAEVGTPERAQRVGLVVDGNNPEHGRYTYLRLAYPDLWSSICMALPRLREWR